jgi:hypothetical protein
MKKYLLLIALIFIYSCTEHKSSSSSRYQDTEDTEYEDSEDYDEDSIEEEEGYPDGTYDATIRVYNPNTGHNATYTLEVEVENEELTKIYWNNGGWLDDSHFSPTNISDGTAYFTDDRGYEYRVVLN